MPIETELTGIVMAGGQSTRMGTDKALLYYHDLPQYKVAENLLKNYCKNVYISCRANAKYDAMMIHDIPKYEHHGPISGLLTAFEHVNGALMILGVDYPKIISKDLDFIVSNRKQSNLATVLINDEGYFEPLIGIYEPTIFDVLKTEFNKGNYSLQNILKNYDTISVELENSAHLKSFDTPDDYKKYKKSF